MAWIETIGPEGATGRLAKLYDAIKGPSGQVDGVLSVHGLRPRTLEGHLSLYKAAMHSLPSELSPRDKELIGVVVSLLNGCDYCVAHHKAGLSKHLDEPGLADALIDEALGRVEARHLGPRELAMARYARKITREPAVMLSSDVQALRAVGLGDAAILELNQVAAYFAYANRTVLGLGVDLADERLGEHPPASDDDDVRHR